MSTRTPVPQRHREPEPACWDNTNRYVDCGNGTVNDTVTTLLWLKDANCFGNLDYAAANAAAAALADGACGLSGGSSAGDWRLPTKAEWEETIARAVVLDCDDLANGDIALTNTPGTACYGPGPQPFTGVQSGGYWSATANADGRYYQLEVAEADGPGQRIGPVAVSGTAHTVFLPMVDRAARAGRAD